MTYGQVPRVALDRSTERRRGDLRQLAARVAVTVLTLLFMVASVGAGRPAGAQAAGQSVYQWGYIQRTIAAVSGLPSDIVTVQAGDWGGMALDASGHVWDWGYGTQGELGDGGTTDSFTTAVEAKGPLHIVSIGEGYNFAAAVDRSGDLWVWGKDPDGALCLDRRTDLTRPVEITKLRAKAVSGGGGHLLILLRNGTVEACGTDTDGQLGNGVMTGKFASPVAVVGLTDVVAISAGNLFSAAREADGSVWTWGYNAFGQLGNGTTTDADRPVEVPLPQPATQIEAGGDLPENGHMVALLSNGAMVSWGDDQWGQLGNGVSGTTFATPQVVDMPAGVSVASVAAGGEDSFAVASDGDLWAWGHDRDGDLGVTTTSRSVVRPILARHGFTIVSATADEGVGLSSGP